MGDDVPFEYATHIKEGAFYGWPWYYIGGNEDPRHKGARPDLKDQVTVPDVLIEAHAAPLQMIFYDGDNFPAEYKGDAFLTLQAPVVAADQSSPTAPAMTPAPVKGEFDNFCAEGLASQASW